jgi:hypothetical protein
MSIRKLDACWNLWPTNLKKGSIFCRGFGGIGGMLRYQLDIRSFDELSDDNDIDDDNDDGVVYEDFY